MSSQYKAPLFTQIVSNQVDRVNARFSDGSPLALNASLTLEDMLKGYQDDKYKTALETAKTKFNADVKQANTDRDESKIDSVTHGDKVKQANMDYAHALYGCISELMKRKGIFPADNADDDNAIAQDADIAAIEEAQ